MYEEKTEKKDSIKQKKFTCVCPVYLVFLSSRKIIFFV